MSFDATLLDGPPATTSGLTVLVGSTRLFVGTGYVVRGHRFRIHDPVKFGRRDIVEPQCRLLEGQVVV
jgi:hypothetical protein